jgi:malonyl-CoA/methylmalonyl-CoA synthetase
VSSSTSSLLTRLLARPAAAPAILDDHGVVRWGELCERATRAAGALLAGRDTLAGARVALLARQDADWVVSFVGILLAGGAAVPLSPAYPAAELAWFGADADVDAVVLSPEHAELGAELARGRRVVAADAWRSGPAAPPRAAGDADPAVILYTSGTTGRPKGAVLTHGNLAIHTALLRDAWALVPEDRLLHALPLHHLHGLGISLLSVLAAGGSARLLPRFDAARVTEALSAGDVSVFMAVPTMYQKLREHVGGEAARLAARLARPRLCTSGSAALPVTLASFWRDVSGAIPLERFGMTEIGVGASNPLAEAARRPGSVGPALPTVELRLVDEHGADAGRGPAELWVRGPSVFPGYWRRDEATASAFAPDGWFRTGDVAELDADGYVRLLGRTSQDILKSGGYKLSALEIEEALREHPDVAEVAVVGLPDETWGERVVAAVVARAGAAPSAVAPEALRGWARTRLAAYKVPREIVVVRALPRNPIGKVVKGELKRMLLGR